MRVSIQEILGSVWGPPKKIALVGRVSIENDPQKFFDLVAKVVNSSRRAPGELTIDLAGADFIYPSSLLFLLSLSKTMGSSTECALELKAKSTIHEYLAFCGFGDHFSIPVWPAEYRPSFTPSEHLKLEIRDQIPNEESYADWYVNEIRKIQPMSEQVAVNTTDCLIEIFRNVKQHSGFTNCFLFGQTYPKSGRVRFCIYDDGDGIKKHFTRLGYDKRRPIFKKLISKPEFLALKHLPANKSIELAAQQDVTGSKSDQNAGAGLHFLTEEFSSGTSSTVAILSEDGYVQWDQGQRTHSIALPFAINGTLISITTSRLT